MPPDRIEVVDLCEHGPASHPVRSLALVRARPIPRPLAAALVLTLVGGAAGAVTLAAADRRENLAQVNVAVTVLEARPSLGVAAPPTSEVDVAVTLALHATVPVTVLYAALDGDPDVYRQQAPDVNQQRVSPPTRSPAVDVHWKVLCAEVGSIPGPRLLDLDLLAGPHGEHRQLLLATDAITRVFRLQAAKACGAG